MLDTSLDERASRAEVKVDLPVRCRFDTDVFAPAERFAAARSFFDGICELRQIGDPKRPFLVRGNSWKIGDCFANHTIHGPFYLQHTSSYLSRDFRILRHIVRGAFTNVFDSTASRFDAKHLTSGRTVGGLAVNGFEYYCLRVPADRVSNAKLRDGNFGATVVEAPTGRLMQQLMSEIFAELNDRGDAEEFSLAQRIDVLVRLAEGELHRLDEGARAVVVAARAKAMRRYIEAHLDDVDLGIGRLAAAFGASRATVFRAFEPDGGIGHAIANRRMTRAFRQLAAAEPKRGLVRTIGEAFGYDDQAHFSRVFRRHLGIAPSDVVGLSLDDEREASGRACSSPDEQARLSQLYH